MLLFIERKKIFCFPLTTLCHFWRFVFMFVSFPAPRIVPWHGTLSAVCASDTRSATISRPERAPDHFVPHFFLIVQSLSRGTGKPWYQCIHRELAHVLLSHKLSQRPCSAQAAAAGRALRLPPSMQCNLSLKQHVSQSAAPAAVYAAAFLA